MKSNNGILFRTQNYKDYPKRLKSTKSWSITNCFNIFKNTTLLWKPEARGLCIQDNLYLSRVNPYWPNSWGGGGRVNVAKEKQSSAICKHMFIFYHFNPFSDKAWSAPGPAFNRVLNEYWNNFTE